MAHPGLILTTLGLQVDLQLLSHLQPKGAVIGADISIYAEMKLFKTNASAEAPSSRYVYFQCARAPPGGQMGLYTFTLTHLLSL